MPYRIGHVTLQTAHGPLSYSDLVSGGRGVTGSEQSMLYLALAQVRMGNQVVCYLPTRNPGFHEGVELLDADQAWPRFRRLDSCDVVISWVTADPMRQLGPGALKVFSVQVNDWLLNTFAYQDHVDVTVAATKAHQGWLLQELGAPGPEMHWEIIPNGVELSRFVGAQEVVRQPYRCVYLSSPDRGLHWLLAMWPEIRFAYPDAELHIFYEVQKWLDQATSLHSEVGVRARYVVSRANSLTKHGVVIHGALPPGELAKELMKADLSLYPCDPVRPTEGFGVAVMEACASGAVPVITDADAFGEVYAESGARMIPRGNSRRWTDEFLEATLSLMAAPSEILQRREAVMKFAKDYDWQIVAGQWQNMIERRLAERRRG